MLSAATVHLLAMNDYNPSQQYMKIMQDRKMVTVRLLPKFRVNNRKGVRDFYEVVERAAGMSLPNYDDYIFGPAPSLDLRFSFSSPNVAEQFKIVLYKTNFFRTGIDSVKWVDTAQSQDCTDNENFTYFTKQGNDDPNTKYDDPMRVRRTGGFNFNFGDGFKHLLDRANDGSKTPLFGSVTPMYNGEEDDTGETPAKKMRGMFLSTGNAAPNVSSISAAPPTMPLNQYSNVLRDSITTDVGTAKKMSLAETEARKSELLKQMSKLIAEKKLEEQEPIKAELKYIKRLIDHYKETRAALDDELCTEDEVFTQAFEFIGPYVAE